MATKARRPKSRVEWTGGIVELPMKIQHPASDSAEIILWLGEDGRVVGQDVALPGEGVLVACTSLKNAMHHPMVTDAAPPLRVRVSNQQLAQMLKAGFPAMEINVLPTPEIDEIAALLRGPAGLRAQVPDDADVWRRLSEQDAFYILDDHDRRWLESILLDMFCASPEAAEVCDGRYTSLVMDIAARFFERTIITLSAADLRTLVLEVVPAHVMLPATEAEPMVTELLAYFSFVERRFGFARAEARRRILSPKAIKTLQKRLSDR